MTGQFLPEILDGLDVESRFAADAYDPEAEPETSVDHAEALNNPPAAWRSILQ
jgi:hypothetical protein